MLNCQTLPPEAGVLTLNFELLSGKDWMPLSSRLRDTTHYLTELPKDRDYMIRVRAENNFGVSEPTEPLWLPRATGAILILSVCDWLLRETNMIFIL